MAIQQTRQSMKYKDEFGVTILLGRNIKEVDSNFKLKIMK